MHLFVFDGALFVFDDASLRVRLRSFGFDSSSLGVIRWYLVPTPHLYSGLAAPSLGSTVHLFGSFDGALFMFDTSIAHLIRPFNSAASCSTTLSGSMVHLFGTFDGAIFGFDCTSSQGVRLDDRYDGFVADLQKALSMLILWKISATIDSL